MFEIAVEESFAAGHALRGYKGKCENVHGHNYKVRVVLAGEKLDSAGLLYDFVELKKRIDEVICALDHKFLNDLPPFTTLNPTAENIARLIFDFATSQGFPVVETRLWETPRCFATYRPQ